MIRIKRVYEPHEPVDGQRILVERLWPRGIKKEQLVLEGWLKDVAPSTQLRKWFGHRSERWNEFQRRYERELSAKRDAWTPIVQASTKGTVTLLYSARDTEHNSARVLRDYLQQGRQSGERSRSTVATKAKHSSPHLRSKSRSVSAKETRKH